MRVAFAVFVALHGLIHGMGFAKAFGLARLEALTSPIGRAMGGLWLGAGLGLVAAAVALVAAPRWFWVAAGVGAIASQVAIVSAWSDARFGTIANAAVVVAALYGAFAWGPFGLREELRRAVAGAIAGPQAATTTVSEGEVGRLPGPVQRYLRYVGAVGLPRPQGFRARFTGRIRGGPEAPWMGFVAEQYNFYDPPRRYFWMDARRGGLPVDVFHRYEAGAASMRVRLLSLAEMVAQEGATLSRAETVTILNDMAIFAPGTLIDPAIEWEEVDARRARATYTQGPHTIQAELVFDEAGALVDFISDDRPALEADGVTLTPQRWSTPIGAYRAQGPVRLASRGEGRYAPASGEYAYLELEDVEVTYAVTEGPR